MQILASLFVVLGVGSEIKDIGFSDILLRATADVLLFILMASFVHIFKSYLSCSLKI